MDATARKLVVEIVGDASSLEREFKRSAQGAKRFERSMGQIGRSKAGGAFQGMGRQLAAATGITLGAAGAIGVLRGAFSELAESQRVAAQTSAVLRSTRGIAGVTAEDVDRLSNKLLKLSGVDDEVIKSGENLLLTFTNIRNVAGAPIFDQATKSALDMSVAMGEDLQQSVIRVGKALQDPVKGATALRRVGVMLTDQQQQRIKGLVEQNRLLDAQKIILGELGREFGGSAAALGNTPVGKINRLRETFKNFAADMVAGTQGKTIPLVDQIQKWLDNTDNQERSQKRLGDAVEFTATQVERLAAGIKFLNDLPRSHEGLLDIVPPRKLLAVAGPAGLLLDRVTRNGSNLSGGAVPGQLGAFLSTGEIISEHGRGGGFTPGDTGAMPPTSGGAGARGVTAAQRNKWFDTRISRRLDRVQDVRTLQGQVTALTTIAGLIKARLAKTKDITRRMTLEDELVGIYRQRAGLNAQIAANKNEKERLKLLDEAEDLANKRARSLERLRNAQESARAAFGELGQGAILTGPMMDRLREWGGKATAQDFIADLRSQVQAFATLQRDLATLRKRGVSQFAIQTLWSQGQAGAEEAHALAGASAGQIASFNRLVGQRRNLVQQAANMQVRTPQMTVHAAAVHIAGSRRKTSRADDRAGARGPGKG